jgi:hypothetical protein
LGERFFSCTIITTEANEPFKPVHDRRPVILAREAGGESVGVTRFAVPGAGSSFMNRLVL